MGIRNQRQDHHPLLHAGTNDLMRLLVDTSSDIDPYLESCARLRDISKTALLNRLIDVIGRDQLVLSVLDDDSRPSPKQKGEHGYRPKIAP